jgi:hypothetical protein
LARERHILVVERVKPDGRANVFFAKSDSAFYDMNREQWRDEATIANGVLTMRGFRTFRYAGSLKKPSSGLGTAVQRKSRKARRQDLCRRLRVSGDISSCWSGLIFAKGVTASSLFERAYRGAE